MALSKTLWIGAISFMEYTIHHRVKFQSVLASFLQSSMWYYQKNTVEVWTYLKKKCVSNSTYSNCIHTLRYPVCTQRFLLLIYAKQTLLQYYLMKFIDHFLFPAHLSAVSPSVPCSEESSGLVGVWWWKQLYISNTLQQTTLPKTDSLSLKTGTRKTPYFPLRRGISLIFLFQVATINVPFGSQHHTPLWRYHCNLTMFMGPHFKANHFSAEVFSASHSPRCCTNPRWWWKAIKKTCSYMVHGSKSWETNWNHFFYTVQQLINFQNDMSILHETTSIISDPMEKQTIACHTHKQIKELLRSSSKTSQLHCLTPELKAYTSWVLRQTPALVSQWVHVDGNGASLIIWNKCMFNPNPPRLWKFEPSTTNKRRGKWSLTPLQAAGSR